jgi:hypothetical protein
MIKLEYACVAWNNLTLSDSNLKIYKINLQIHVMHIVDLISFFLQLLFDFRVLHLMVNFFLLVLKGK